jgi:hypothetical protein
MVLVHGPPSERNQSRDTRREPRQGLADSVRLPRLYACRDSKSHYFGNRGKTEYWDRLGNDSITKSHE